MWPQCGREPAFRPLMRDACALHARRGIRAEIAWPAGLILGPKALTRPAPQDYIDPLGRAAAWRDGASAKPLTVSHGDRASGHALCGHVRRRVGCDGLYVLRLWLSRLCRRRCRDDGAARFRAV